MSGENSIIESYLADCSLTFYFAVADGKTPSEVRHGWKKLMCELPDQNNQN